MRKKYYVGHLDGSMEVFTSDIKPTPESHGDKYWAVTGPFRTKRGALFMQKYGQGNPHCRNVAEAEKLAKENKE